MAQNFIFFKISHRPAKLLWGQIISTHQFHRLTTDRRSHNNFIARRRTDEIFRGQSLSTHESDSATMNRPKLLGIFETRDIYFRDRQIYGIFIFAIDQSRDRQISRSQISRSRSPEIDAFRERHFSRIGKFVIPGILILKSLYFKKKKKNPPNFPVKWALYAPFFGVCLWEHPPGEALKRMNASKKKPSTSLYLLY